MQRFDKSSTIGSIRHQVSAGDRFHTVGEEGIADRVKLMEKTDQLSIKGFIKHYAHAALQKPPSGFNMFQGDGDRAT